MKVSAVITFHNQENNKEAVIKFIKPQVDQIIVIENQGHIGYQRNLGLKQAQHDLILFCDGDILVEDGFVQAAKELMEKNSSIAIVGGRISTTKNTQAEQLMDILRWRAYKINQMPAGCFLLNRKRFGYNVCFGEPPDEISTVYEFMKTFEINYKKVDYKLLHIGEPTTREALLERQRRYGTKKCFNWLRFILFGLTPLGSLTILPIYIHYSMNNDTKDINVFDMITLFYQFMHEYYWSSYNDKASR